jgi:hypothetical protein
MCHTWPRTVLVLVTILPSFRISWLITGLIARLTRRVPLEMQESISLENFPCFFVGFAIAQSLVFCVGGADHYPFSFGYCIACLCQFTWFADHFRVFKRLCSGVCVAWSLVFLIGLCWPLFALLFFDLWPLYCLPSISGFYVFGTFRLFLFPLCVRNFYYCPWQ